MRWTASSIERAAPVFVSADPDHQPSQMIVAHDAKGTRWIDPLTGAVYREGIAAPIADVGRPPGLVSIAALQAAGAYFGPDFERANDRDWMWAWDPAKRRAYGMRLGSSKFVCELDLSE